MRFRVWNTSSHVILTACYNNTAVFCCRAALATLVPILNTAVFCTYSCTQENIGGTREWRSAAAAAGAAALKSTVV